MFKDDIELAKKIRLNAHAPICKFQVGAVLRTKDNKIYTGCNIENQGIQGICAERVAFAKAISEGERSFKCITIVGSEIGKDANEECLPCGYCRQFMSEFVDSNFKIYTYNSGNIKEYTIDELLPYSFKF